MKKRILRKEKTLYVDPGGCHLALLPGVLNFQLFHVILLGDDQNLHGVHLHCSLIQEYTHIYSRIFKQGVAVIFSKIRLFSKKNGYD